MKRTWPIWLAFACGVAMAAGAMAYVSAEMLRMDAAERRANRQADAETKVGLALWRMDSALIPLIATESARPVEGYTAAPAASPQVLLHFELSPDGRLSLPTAAKAAAPAPGRSGELAAAMDGPRRQRLLAAVPKLPATVQPNPAGDPASAMRDQALTNLAQQRADRTNPQRSRADLVQAMNTVEQVMRQSATVQAQNVDNRFAGPLPAHRQETAGPLLPVWMDGMLLLARRGRIAGEERLQGAWLNWEHIRKSLAETVSDLLPEADLAPAPDAGARQPYTLASLPVRLAPGAVPEEIVAGGWPVAWTLAISWAALAAAAAAAAFVLASVLALSRRREMFATAVTHELRTPLTTFRLYSEMLAEGLIPDEAARGEYLRRLCDEAQRLSHLVENVLSYARLSGRRPGEAAEAVPLGQLLERSRESLEALARRAGMELAVTLPPLAAATVVRCNADAAGQVLLNLVDNARKYAASAEDRRIELAAAVENGTVEIRVRDHGPGVPTGEVRRLFRAFGKSAQQAAKTAPGVGLGLALSRRLARDMRGDLRYERAAEGGACFVLSLPRGD
jgi:signal transduction histidine kinase